jgi:hypothetical protein
MRLTSFIAVAFFLAGTSSGFASTYEIPTSGEVQFGGETVITPFTLSIEVTGDNYDGTVPPNNLTGPFYGYTITAEAGDAEVQACAFSQVDSGCARSLINYNVGFIDPQNNFTLTPSVYEQLDSIDPPEVQLFVTFTDPAVFIQAVPEISTWAMLLIGFAGIGFAARRRHQFPKPAGTVSAYAVAPKLAVLVSPVSCRFIAGK